MLELWRLSLDSLEFLAELDGVEDLSLVNVKVADPSGLAQIPSLRRLFLNGTASPAGWGFLADLEQLAELELLNSRGPVALPDLGRLTALRRFRAWGCKGLTDVSFLQGVENLESVELVDTGLRPEDLTALLEKASLWDLHAVFATKKANELLAQLRADAGKAQFAQ